MKNSYYVIILETTFCVNVFSVTQFILSLERPLCKLIVSIDFKTTWQTIGIYIFSILQYKKFFKMKIEETEIVFPTRHSFLCKQKELVRMSKQVRKNRLFLILWIECENWMIPDIYWLAIRKSLKLAFTNIYNQKTATDLSVFLQKAKHKSYCTHGYWTVLRIQIIAI